MQSADNSERQWSAAAGCLQAARLGIALTSSSTDMQFATTCASGSFCSMSCRSSNIPAPKCLISYTEAQKETEHTYVACSFVRFALSVTPAFLTAAASRLYIFKTPSTAVRRTYGFLSCSASDTGETYIKIWGLLDCVWHISNCMHWLPTYNVFNQICHSK